MCIIVKSWGSIIEYCPAGDVPCQCQCLIHLPLQHDLVSNREPDVMPLAPTASSMAGLAWIKFNDWIQWRVEWRIGETRMHRLRSVSWTFLARRDDWANV